jgi:glycosyltransferase involved in cell wall biosynthesis
MVLIFSINGALMGGAEGVLMQIARYWQKKGKRVQVVFLSKRQGNQWESVLGNDHIAYVYFSIKILFFLARHKFEYTFTSHTRTNGFIGMLRSLGVLHTTYLIGREPSLEKSMLKTFVYFLYRTGYKGLDTLVCQTQEMKELFIKTYKRYTSITNVIPNPFDWSNAVEKGNEAVVLQTNDPYIVAAGRFIHEKGFDVLLKAFFRLKQVCKELKLVIIGDGKLRGEIESLIKELGVENDIILNGFVYNVYPFFKKASMCVVSSRAEGFPNVLLQMMSQNEKIVATLCAGDIDKLEGVFTCKSNDEEDLLRAMKACLEADTSKNRELFDRELQRRSIDKFIECIKIEHTK